MNDEDFRFEIGQVVGHILTDRYIIMILDRKIDTEGWIKGKIYDCRILWKATDGQIYMMFDRIARFSEIELMEITNLSYFLTN